MRNLPKLFHVFDELQIIFEGESPCTRPHLIQKIPQDFQF